MTARRADASSPIAGRGWAVLLLSLGLAACGGEATAPPAAQGATTVVATAPAPTPQGDLEAVALELGTALDADGRVIAPVERVRPADAVHVSLVTVGSAEAARVVVTWRDGAGATLASDERSVAAEGPAVHTATRQPAEGWATGRYEVEVSLDGQSAGVRGFEVR